MKPYVFRDGTNGQYIILNKDKKLLITIMASEQEMKNAKVSKIFNENNISYALSGGVVAELRSEVVKLHK